MADLRVAVVGVGSFGKNHVRIINELDGVTLAGLFDLDYTRAEELGPAFRDLGELASNAQCAIVATPTVTHESVASELLKAGLDVLIEKPIAHSAAAGQRLADLADRHGRILQVGHLERFNPAIAATERVLTVPIFFEVHRLSLFTPRSLDIDVVLDLMIHDLDIVLTFTKELPSEVRASGISVLSPHVDIANVRLAFPSGAIANLTASRISTERVRKLRLFQPGEYISVDYQRQDAVRLAVRSGAPPGSYSIPILHEQLPTEVGEPLKLELASFFDSVRTRTAPKVTAAQATNALRVAEEILANIKEHSAIISKTVGARSLPQC